MNVYVLNVYWYGDYTPTIEHIFLNKKDAVKYKKDLIFRHTLMDKDDFEIIKYKLK
jgi:hypothetical protein